MDLIVVTNAEFDEHLAPAGHPERGARTSAALAGIAAGVGDRDGVEVRPSRPATVEEVAVVHERAVLDGLADLAAAGGGHLDPDTYVTGGSWSTALHATGAGLEAVAAVKSGEASAAFVVARPPGHHASAERPSGFCLVNSIAVAAAHLRAAGERVAIVDWDVHHGHGTQDIFWSDPDVLFVSLHSSRLYPGTGRYDEVGAGAGENATMNVPLPPGTTGDVVLAALDEVVAPRVESFAPTWVLVSAGFDGHRADPLANWSLTAGDYADLAARVTSFAPGGRTVLFLEGGYDLDALTASVAATASALSGGGHRPEPASTGGPGREVVDDLARWWRDRLA